MLYDNKRYIKIIYNMSCEDILDIPNFKNRCSLFRDMLITLGFAYV